ncbi:MAG: hypothetical protein EG825_12580 [Rhodocyclaceae bacterium]|nr:hypothetical protein [Rhodocyclaceae bacterium]
MKRILILLLGLGFALASLAQSLEIVNLRYRLAEDIVPQLQPFVEPGGAISGVDDKIYFRVSPRNRADLMKLIESLDRPARRVMISVRQDGDSTSQRQGAGVSGDLALGRNARIIVPGGNGGGGTVEVRRGDSVVRGNVYDSQRSSSERIGQQVQTIDGGRAFINVGQMRPLPFTQWVMGPNGAMVSQGVVYQDIGTGFYAVPRLAGDSVTIEVSPRHDTPGSIPGSVNVQRLSTTVRGRLGEWIALGGSGQEQTGQGSGTASYSSRDAQQNRQVWLKVEELP